MSISRKIREQLQIIGDKEVLTNCKNVYALRGSRISSELAMLENIRTLHPASMPILQLLLNSSKTSSHQVPLDVETFELANEAIAKYSLNEDQAKVLNTVANWFSLSGNDSAIDSSNPEFCLVHGPFGSGKSHLLVILVIFLSELLERRSHFSTRILVSAATNVAVDRILTGLLKHGFTNFLRVGSLKMIAKNILPYSLQVACKGDDDEMGPGIHTQQTDEKLKEQKKRLNMVRVVGVTCFSTTKAVFEGSRFKVCLLDECSQIPEPLSLLPLCGFGCEKLVAAGDPAQLPPLLSGGCGITDSKASQNCENAPWDTHLYNDPEHDSDKILQGFSANLTRPLFVRLVAMGHEPVLLRTQYRCHPRLARISNNLFYNGQLKNGCSEVQRLPLVEGLPPLLFFETHDLGREVRDNLNSYCNLYEAKLACQLVTHLLKKGVLGNQIGVIVLYKSQACLVQKLFTNQKDVWQSTGSCIKKASRVRKSKELKILKEGPCLIEDVQVSTVDAFQGMEKDVIILSCCRTNALGFLSSPNRVNVALTRARHHLIIIGKAENLRKSWFWRELVTTVQSTPGAHESASRLITDFQRAMEENGRTISHCEEDYLQIQDLNQDPRKSKNTPHVMASTGHSLRSQILPDFPSKYQQETNSFFADKEPDKVHKVINDWQKFNSGAQEVTRNHANCYSEQCPSEVSISRSKGGNEEFGKVAVQSEQGRPEVLGALPICSVEMEETLDELSFRAIDFWDGYKLYCIGHYSHSAEHKKQFLQSKMGRALCKLYGELKLFRGASFDEIVRQAWSMMEDYVKSRYGEDCKNIWTLIKAYDNLEELAATEYGNFFLQIAEEESSRAESSQTMVDKITDGDEEEIFYQLRQQLGKMDNRIQHLEGRGPMSKDESIESSTASFQEHSKRPVNFNAGDDVKNRTCAAVVSERTDCELEVSCLSENTGWNW
ncbi:hypothetical protein O6H91_22G017200 [Diphasiastrum complanatum]|uniref:Uncharacterized protein n=2 Tax=Diphasiastrum complanatum TaxID=34168 RepID=A0ACC2ADG8_DIPCM|nr:hypothetical protein O6H91_22G017200 [Diphasiastrum complanatum]